jgi:hypothetical protein
MADVIPEAEAILQQTEVWLDRFPESNQFLFLAETLGRINEYDLQRAAYTAGMHLTFLFKSSEEPYSREDSFHRSVVAAVGREALAILANLKGERRTEAVRRARWAATGLFPTLIEAAAAADRFVGPSGASLRTKRQNGGGAHDMTSDVADRIQGRIDTLTYSAIGLIITIMLAGAGTIGTILYQLGGMSERMDNVGKQVASLDGRLAELDTSIDQLGLYLRDLNIYLRAQAGQAPPIPTPPTGQSSSAPEPSSKP